MPPWSNYPFSYPLLIFIRYRYWWLIAKMKKKQLCIAPLTPRHISRDDESLMLPPPRGAPPAAYARATVPRGTRRRRLAAITATATRHDAPDRRRPANVRVRVWISVGVRIRASECVYPRAIRAHARVCVTVSYLPPAAPSSHIRSRAKSSQWSVPRVSFKFL